MKINFVKNPPVIQFSMMGEVPSLKEYLINNHQVDLDLHFKTKTYIGISVQAGTTRFGYDVESDYSKENNLSMVKKIEMNYFYGESFERVYFKLTKKQNEEVLREHLLSLGKKLLHDLHLQELISDDSFTLNVYTPNSLSHLIGQSYEN